MVYHVRPSEFDISHPDFRDRCRLWALGLQCEIMEIVLTTKETITVSQNLLEQVDRMLARGPFSFR